MHSNVPFRMLATILASLVMLYSNADTIIALFTFNDMTILNDGTTRVNKDLSTDIEPSIILVEAGGALAVSGGATGIGLTDEEGVAHDAGLSASWTTGLPGAQNAGSNYFVLETSTRGFHLLKLRFDTFSSTSLGPQGLTLAIAVGNGDFENLDPLMLTRNSSWQSHVQVLSGIAGIENAARVRIRGTWSADATGGSGRIDNLQLTGALTQGFARAAHFPFTGNSFDGEGATSEAGLTPLATENIWQHQFLETMTRTQSGPPCLAVSPSNYNFYDTYHHFSLTTLGRTAVRPALLQCHARVGGEGATGVVEAAVIVLGTEYRLGSLTINDIERPLTFRIPEALKSTWVTAPIEFRLYFMTQGLTSFRVDDVSVFAWMAEVDAQPEMARFTFTDNALADVAGHRHLTVSDVFNQGTGAMGFNANPYASESGPPVLTVSGLNGGDPSRHIAFDVIPRSVSVKPTLVSLFARTALNTGRMEAFIETDGKSYSMGAVDVDATVRHYFFAIPPALDSPVTGPLRLRLHAWNLDSAERTLRIDDWALEGIVGSPPQGFITVLR